MDIEKATALQCVMFGDYANVAELTEDLEQSELSTYPEQLFSLSVELNRSLLLPFVGDVGAGVDFFQFLR